MPNTDDRRVAGAQRVPLEQVVDVSVEHRGKSSAFQAQTLDVSGGGMHLRARQAPELGGPLVLRFRISGGEVLAEAEVAWHSEGKKGCDFGVRFTALDTLSLRTLKSLCGGTAKAGTLRDLAAYASGLAASAREEAPEPTALEREFFGNESRALSNSEGSDESVPPSAVKLHIDGVAQPMRAQVRQLAPGRLSVGSPLDFLSVGKAVEVEDVATGGRRFAQIGDVGVRVDPRSQIPELLVSVRYGKGSASVSNSLLGAPAVPPLPESLASGDSPAVNDSSLESEARTGTTAKSDREESMSVAPREQESDEEVGEEYRDEHSDPEEPESEFGKWGETAATATRSAFHKLGQLGGGVTQGAGALLKKASLPSRSRSSEPRQRARPMRRTSAAPSSSGRERARRQGVRFEGRRSETTSGRTGAARRPLVAIGVAAVLGLGIWLTGGDSEVASAPVASLSKVQSALSPAVVSSPSSIKKGVAPAATLKRNIKLPASPPSKSAVATPSAKPPEKLPRIFSRGRLHLPIIHRIKLDAPGVSLHGKSTLTGFEVRIPNRKAVGSTAAIARQDKRIAKVLVTNGSNGATINVRFHRAIPPYKIRLKNGNVELFISSK